MDEVLVKLVEFVENASPVIWEAAQRQVVADMATNAIWIVAAVGLAAFLVWVARGCENVILGIEEYNEGKGWSNAKDSEGWHMSLIMSYVGVVALTLGALVLLTGNIRMAINPTYYAIQNIMGMVP